MKMPPRTKKLFDIYLNFKGDLKEDIPPNIRAFIRCMISELGDMERSLLDTKEDNKELQELFDLQHKRTVEAEKLWQAEHENPDTLPDLGELLKWLIEKKISPK